MRSLITPVLFVLLFLNCSTGKVSDRYEISGSWDWECCGGKNHGNMILMQNSNDSITGQMFDNIDRSGGRIDGKLSGRDLIFTRSWEKNKQEFKLQVSQDGRTLSGSFNGGRDTTAGFEFSAVRK